MALRSASSLLLLSLALVARAQQVQLAPTPTPTALATSPAQCASSEGGEYCAQPAGDLEGLIKRQQANQPQQASSSSSTINIPQSAADGGISMTQPAATAQATSNLITFGWNFTDVIASPTYLTIQAFCSQNGNTYPVGPTSGLPGGTTQYVWNPYDYEQAEGATPLAEASYTLRIFDERGYGAAASPGYMRPYAGTVFAMYRPQNYVSLADGWTCAAGSAAMRATPIHPAVIATAAAIFAGSLLVFARIH